jgi:hypothetical protein
VKHLHFPEIAVPVLVKNAVPGILAYALQLDRENPPIFPSRNPGSRSDAAFHCSTFPRGNFSSIHFHVHLTKKILEKILKT